MPGRGGRFTEPYRKRGRVRRGPPDHSSRPRSQPDLAEALCDAITELTAERAARSHGPQWIMVHSVARYLGISEEQAQQAVALAVQRHWIQTDGSVPPHSVALDWGLREG